MENWAILVTTVSRIQLPPMFQLWLGLEMCFFPPRTSHIPVATPRMTPIREEDTSPPVPHDEQQVSPVVQDLPGNVLTNTPASNQVLLRGISTMMEKTVETMATMMQNVVHKINSGIEKLASANAPSALAQSRWGSLQARPFPANEQITVTSRHRVRVQPEAALLPLPRVWHKGDTERHGGSSRSPPFVSACPLRVPWVQQALLQGGCPLSYDKAALPEDL